MTRTLPWLTEHLKVAGPIVYGYLRLPVPNPARRTALTWAMATYCDEHELTLAGVFTDLTGNPAKVLTPGFVGLLDALVTEGTYGAVLPSAAHLGSRPAGEERSGLLQATGRRLMFCRTAHDEGVAAPIRAGTPVELRAAIDATLAQTGPYSGGRS